MDGSLVAPFGRARYLRANNLPCHTIVAEVSPCTTQFKNQRYLMKAAVLHAPNEPLTVEDIEIDAPIGREVLVRTVASGVCHSDLHHVDGLFPLAMPAVLGHEAAGIVEAVGDQVEEFKPGDHVIAC